MAFVSEDAAGRIAGFYDGLVDRFGHDPRACDYGNPASQTTKYRVLADVANLDNRSVLDVGCGFADYADYLETRFTSVRYTGIDLSKRMIEEAKRRRTGLTLMHGSILDWSQSARYDIVTANGIFYLLGPDAKSSMKLLVERMFSMCTHAVAFNSLSSWASQQQDGEFYADPLETVAFCRTITPWVVLRHDYLAHDFAIYLYRDRVAE